MSTISIEQAIQNAVALKRAGQIAEAEAIYRQVLAVQPHNPDALQLLGVIAQETGHYQAAVDLISRAVAAKPYEPGFVYNLGNALDSLERLDEAIACYQRAVTIRPDFGQAYINQASVLKDQGRIALAVTACREAARALPDAPFVHSVLLFAMHLAPASDASAIYAEHRQWARQHEEPRRRFRQPFANDPHPDRRLKVGYVSPDLHNHPIGRFLALLLQNHDHERYETFCYAETRKTDSVTEALCSYTDQWHTTAALSEEQLAAQIRDDGIDILVDLALHTVGNRLPVFARKPAPVQVTYLAYCSTSGLDAMDYRLTDPCLDPPGASDDCYSERSIRLPHTYWCYPIPPEAPDVNPVPAQPAGHITFGSLNSFGKVNERVIAVWARLLRAVPDSRLLLHARKGNRERLLQTLAREDISPQRMCFIDFRPPAEHFARYGLIDIALDTFPYAGGTTTCDALWMGVPVVSLVGKTAVGRGGLSILSNIGLPELVAHSEDEYVKIAKDLAADLPRLVELRTTLRDRMLASPLMDAPRFARNIEDAYRTMWKTWCEKQTEGAIEP